MLGAKKDGQIITLRTKDGDLRRRIGVELKSKFLAQTKNQLGKKFWKLTVKK